MFYHKDGCPKQKAGQPCFWSHEVAFTNPEKNSMAVIAEKCLQQEKDLKVSNGKGKSGKPSGCNSDTKGKKRDGKKSNSGSPQKSDQPCRSWTKDGTCSFGGACRYVHAEK